MAKGNDTINFKTKKTVQELAGDLRSAMQQLGANSMDRLEDDDPLGGLDGTKSADISVVISGSLGFLGAFKSFGGKATDIWAVEVYVFDTGAERTVALVSQSESAVSRMFGQYAGQSTIDGKTSKKKRDELANILMR